MAIIHIYTYLVIISFSHRFPPAFAMPSPDISAPPALFQNRSLHEP